jgi:hypothetical protein
VTLNVYRLSIRGDEHNERVCESCIKPTNLHVLSRKPIFWFMALNASAEIALKALKLHKSFFQMAHDPWIIPPSHHNRTRTSENRANCKLASSLFSFFFFPGRTRRRRNDTKLNISLVVLFTVLYSALLRRSLSFLSTYLLEQININVIQDGGEKGRKVEATRQTGEVESEGKAKKGHRCVNSE